MSLSGLCIIHCLGLPLIISLAPVFAWAEGEWVHLSLAGMALIVWMFAMRSWIGGLRGLLLRVLGAVALVLLFVGALAEITEFMEQAVTTVAASMLAASHILAWLASRTQTAAYD
jgi:hypothetical protein